MRTTRAGAALLGLGLVLAACDQAQPARVGESEAAVASSASSVAASSPSAAASGAASSSAAAGPPAHPGLSPASPVPTADRRQSQRGGGIGSDWGPSRAELRRARRIAARMPLRRLAGQVIVAEYDGQGPPTALVNGLHLGGVIVMRDNIAGTRQLRRSNRALQVAARDAGRRWPVFIGVDQEGGIVERVRDRATRFPSFMSAGAARDRTLTRRAAAASGAELVDLGFSVVFAPVGDVTSGPRDPTIGSRSPGSSPGLVARQMNAAVVGYRSAGILPVIKHFPGHGSVPADSHHELPVQDRSVRQLRTTDLVPFEKGIAAGAPAVMAGHIDVRAVDPGTPSSLSRPVVTGLLRRDMGFEGLVVTDAMNMAAVSDRYSSAAAAVWALRAGSDVVLMPPSPRAARDGIVRAVSRGSLARPRVEQAAARQIAVLLHQRDVEPALTRRPGTSARASYRLSAGAVTVASGPCHGRLVGAAVRATGPAEAAARFDAAAARAGLRTGSGTHVALVGYGEAGADADVVVTLDTPYALGRSDARIAKLAMYGNTRGAMRALVEVLLGTAHAPGRLPVPVHGVARTGCPPPSRR